MVTPSEINEMYKDDEQRFLTLKEKEYICSKIKIPYPGIKKIIKLINRQLQGTAMKCLNKVQIFESFIPLYFIFIENAFLRSLEEPGAPIGPRTADAVGQQATQTLLNAFHQAGSAKSGGADGIRENITISRKRKNPYSKISPINQYLTVDEVMDMKRIFQGVSVSDLATEIIPITVNIDDHLNFSVSEIDTPLKCNDLFKNGIFWWYSFGNSEEIYHEEPRTAIRIKLDVEKLYDFKITTTDIANILTKRGFPITKTTKSSKENTSTFVVIAIPSPTYIGIIDLFISHQNGPKDSDMEKDFFLPSLIASGEFKTIYVSGIEGIKNFYPVSVPTLSLVRDIEEVKEGTRVYLENVRFSVPVSKLIRLIKSAGFEIEGTDESNESNLDFNSHKIIRENRKNICVTAQVYNEEFDGNFYFRKETPNKGGSELFVSNNNFFTLNSEPIIDEEYTYEIILLDKLPIKYYFLSNINSKMTYDIEDKNELCDFIDAANEDLQKICQIMSGELEDIPEDFEAEFLRSLVPKIDLESELIFGLLDYTERGILQSRNFAGFNVQVNDKNVYHVALTRRRKIIFDLEVNLDFINSGNNCSSLNNVINAYFSSPEFAIPKKYRLPLIEVFNFESSRNDYLLIKSKIFFRDDVDPYENGKKKIHIGSLKTKVNESIRQEEKYKEELKKITPFSRFKSIINSNVKSVRLKEYVYIETMGFSITSLCSHPLVDSKRTYCNDFFGTLELFGIEALYNLLAFEMIEMVNKSGYINVEYPKLVAATTTANGVNPMTSQGVFSQKRNILSQITFDNASKYISDNARIGNNAKINNVSANIFIGSECKLGTGFAEVEMDDTKLSSVCIVRDLAEQTLEEADEEQDPYYENVSEILTVDFNKFPKVKWVINEYVSRNFMFYIEHGKQKISKVVKPKTVNIDSQKFVTEYMPMFNKLVIHH